MRKSCQIKPGIIPFWMFNDAAGIAQRIDYLRACRRGGIMALALHARAGNLLPYGSAEWYETARALVEEASRLKMNIWLYDEDPFPSGAAGGMVMAQNPGLMATAMAWHEKPDHLKTGALWVLGAGQALWAGLIPTQRPGPAKELPLPAGSIRTDWCSGPWDSRYYYFDTPAFACERGNAVNMRFAMRVPEIPKGWKLAAITIENPGLDGPWNGLPDLLNPAAFHEFERLSISIYKQYVGRHFGATIPGIFTDEAKPHGYMPLTSDLFPCFKKRYGYDLKTRIHHLFGEPLDEAYIKTRVDYRRWVADRFLEAFVQPYRRWCDRHNLMLVGHFSPEDDPIWETACLGAVQPIMRTMSLPGTDIIVPMPGNAKAPCLNLGSLRVGSIKSQDGLAYGISESGACAGWTTTSEELRGTLAWQRVLGVNRFFVHGFFNSAEGVSLAEAPPDYGPNSSIFPGISAVNEWVKACDVLSDGGEELAPVAIVDGVLSYWDWAPGLKNNRHEQMRRNLWNTILACLQAHVGAHMVEEAQLASAQISRGCITVGKRRYSWILTPDSERLSQAAVKNLTRAWNAGVPVWWFGGGPKTAVDERYRFHKLENLPGVCLDGPAPSYSWCCRHLPALARLEGKGRENVYLRRFTSMHGGHFLMAVNVEEHPLNLRLLSENGLVWRPCDADGDVDCDSIGSRWRVTGRGCGLFELAALPAKHPGIAVAPRRRQTGAARHFARLAPNVLRLDKPLASWGGNKQARLPFPKPYWSLTDAFSATRSCSTFLGNLPVESRMHDDARLSYSCEFVLAKPLRSLFLSMDPRFARGRFTIFLNGHALGKIREWPLNGIAPERVKIPALKKGRHVIEFKFEAGSAMDGLLSWAYFEGDFDLNVAGQFPVLSPTQGLDSSQGWQKAGMPHYMGQGCYSWTENLSDLDALGFSEIEFDGIVDSAELSLNGCSLGRRAWSPWRWVLRGLKPGINRFELIVSSTAGNKFSLEWPNQPQGWIGKAWLR